MMLLGRGPAVATRMVDAVMAVILAICALTLPLSVYEAGWAPAATTLPVASLLALAGGALIARISLPRLARWALVVTLGWGVAMLCASLFATSLHTTLTRMAAWGTDLLAGRVVDDPALVTFWVALLVWWAGYNAAHGIARGGRALEALLPTLIVLALNVIYTRQGITYIGIMSFGIIILMAWTAESKHQATWSVRSVDYPTELWPDWLGGSFLIAGVVCVLALLLSLLTSGVTIRWISHTFDRPVSQVQQIAMRLLGGANKIGPNVASQGGVAFLPTSRLINEAPQLLDRLVMWVWTDEAPPAPTSVPVAQVNRAGWRGLTYMTYSGRGWSNPGLAARPLPGHPPAGSEPAGGFLKQRYEIVTAHGDTLFAVNQPVSGDANITALYRSDDDVVGLRGTLSQYAVTSHVISPSEDDLRKSPTNYSTEIKAYLQLPDSLPRRVRDLTAQVTAGVPTPYDKAVKIESFLRTYTYTLDLPPLPDGRDLADYFLFDAPGGYCDYYASAMVVMLRSVGVPARLASGYTWGAYDYAQGAYRVIDADAHSWPEVYFGGIGWLEFEPTASRPLLTRARSAPAAVLSAGQVRTAQAWRERLAELAWGAAGLALLLAALGAYLAWRDRQLALLPTDELIPLLYQRLRQRGAWLGMDVSQSDTPDEFVRAFNLKVEQHAGQTPRWQAHIQIAQQAAAQISQLYRNASYSPHKIGTQEARQVLKAWRALRLRMWLVRISNFKFQISDYFTSR